MKKLIPILVVSLLLTGCTGEVAQDDPIVVNKTVKKEFKTEDEIDRLYIRDKNVDITLMPNKESETIVSYEAEEDGNYEIKIGENNTLSIVKVKPFVSEQLQKLTVSLPEKTYEKLNINADIGDIVLENTESKDLQTSATNGDTILDNVNIQEISVKTGNGNVYLNNLESMDIKVSDVNGDVVFNNPVADFYKVAVFHGDIKGVIKGLEDDYIIFAHALDGSNNLNPEEKDEVARLKKLKEEKEKEKSFNANEVKQLEQIKEKREIQEMEKVKQETVKEAKDKKEQLEEKKEQMVKETEEKIQDEGKLKKLKEIKEKKEIRSEIKEREEQIEKVIDLKTDKGNIMVHIKKD